ncbi:MAG: hypothetical protein U0M31_05055 [Oscillospiraceae bacterium]|nr:hypothetical protein [Oscillospiraceae bacterium]
MDNKKIVAVWLTRAEDANETVRARIDGLCREYKPRKYQVAVYKSGREDLHTSVLDLLAYNKRRAAELQVQREKAAKAERAAQER